MSPCLAKSHPGDDSYKFGHIHQLPAKKKTCLFEAGQPQGHKAVLSFFVIMLYAREANLQIL